MSIEEYQEQEIDYTNNETETENECECEYEEFHDEEIKEDDIFYFKYEFEGCQNIDDILSNLERLKDLFQKFKNEGYKLREDVSSGYCFLYKEE